MGRKGRKGSEEEGVVVGRGDGRGDGRGVHLMYVISSQYSHTSHLVKSISLQSHTPSRYRHMPHLAIVTHHT
ncbi:unnamed protein product, partial [Closterium sp. NIES-54]